VVDVAPGQQLLAALERLEERVDTTSYGVRSRDTNSIVLAWSARLAAHKLQLDLRHDDNSVSGRVETGKLGWAYDLAPQWTVRAGIGSAFRAPNFNELYFPGYGVEALRPERSHSAEVGVAWRVEETSASLTVYRHRVRDLISYEPDRSFCPVDPSYDFGCARNIDRARLQGATIGAAHRVGAWSLRASVDFLDAKDLATGQRLTRRAAHQENLGVDWAEAAWSAGGTLLGVGARPEGGVQLAAYQLLDLYARYRVAPRWRVEARVLNTLDKSYEPARDYQSPGRQAWIGVRYDGAGL
jgi:vitamin B12 transporter